MTNAQGQYSAQGLEPGTYTVLITKSGYNDLYQGRVLVGTQGNLGLNFLMPATASSQSFREDFNGTALNGNYWTGVVGISGYTESRQYVQRVLQQQSRYKRGGNYSGHCSRRDFLR